MTISAVLVVRDEEQMLEGCLRSLAFCDETVVVIDDRTADMTEAIARRHTDKVISRPFQDYAQMRNEGIALATGAWILHVDADERITPELAGEMRGAVAADSAMLGFRSPTINFFWGRRMRHGGWVEWQTRLVRRELAVYRGRVHESLPIPSGRVGTLKGERWHFSHRSIEENLRKAIDYGRLEAADLYERGAPEVTPWTLVWAMALEFGRRMVRRVGWRDGMPGTIEGLFQPTARLTALVMLWERQQGDAMRERYKALDRDISQRAASDRSAAE
jgi:(heptosyl)LPS beta-1,4-glucosyltransferase